MTSPRRSWHVWLVSGTTLAVLASLLLAVIPTGALAVRSDGFGGAFEPLSSFKQSRTARTNPTAYAAFAVDTATVRAQLSSGEISVPDPDGRPVRFSVVPDSVMESELAAAHPEIQTYAGRGIDDPALSLRADVTPMGFHAAVRSPRGSWFMDPATDHRGESRHLSYYTASLPAVPESISDAFARTDLDDLHEETAGAATSERAAPAAGAVVPLRTYRLALASDPAYAAYFQEHDGDSNVLSQKVTLINRVNQIYEADVNIKMILIDDTEKLNFDTTEKASGADGPCGGDPCYSSDTLEGGCSSDLLTANEFALGQVVGADSFDIGHIGLGTDGGGIAGLGVVGEQYKADGCTGLATPVGDFYAIDYVAHEMGHEFNGNHTFNGNLGSCAATNRNASTSVEPGSGSSVMAYAGICDADDLQPHTDPYFSQRSIDEIQTHATADPTTYSEVQTVNLRGWDATADSITLTYKTNTVTITNNRLTSYNLLALNNSINTLVGGSGATVSGYNGGLLPDEDGFTVTFGSDVDEPRLEVTATTGAEAFVGVITNGGPGTNQGYTVETTVDGVTNHAPTVTAPAAATIPIRTPFELTGSGVDPDGDPLVYLWEQNNAGGTVGSNLTVSANRTNGPLFRVFGTRAVVDDATAITYGGQDVNLATGSPYRSFPDMQQVLDGNTNIASGSCPTVTTDPTDAQIDCYSEFLPTATYTPSSLSFRLTARDLALPAGGVQHADVTLTLNKQAGPLLVSSQAAAASYDAGATGTVTWTVNGTDATALAPTVRITMSADGGQTWPYTLSETTANDGSESVVWPDVSTEHARIKISAVGNYFYNVNGHEFTIVGPTVTPTTSPTVSPTATDSTSPTSSPTATETATETVTATTTATTTTTPDASTPPETSLAVAGLRNGYLNSQTLALTLRSDQPGATFACTLDGRALPCSASTRTRGLKRGRHLVTAAATRGGLSDATPAQTVLWVTADDRGARRSKGWRELTLSGFRGNSAGLARVKGATMTWRVRKVRQLSLFAPRLPKGGKVAVYLNGRRYTTISLAGSATSSIEIPIATLTKRFSGKVRITTLSGRPVFIDSLGYR
ncbi:MAG: M12 family metallo-peptidase [Nocardioides sp.]|uniref:M12 family metallo-peptidase n=1 Tax=Nocardioides sp. TaxID=35761 RepID=UPI0039E4D406